MRKILVYILALLLFVACKAEDEDLYLEVEKRSVTFLSASGVEMIPVNTNVEYKANSSSEWCTVSSAANQLRVTVTDNVDIKERTAVIILSAEAVPDIRIDVKQAGTDPFFSIDSELKTQQFGSESQSRSLKVVANVSFTAQSNQTWCQVETLGDATRNLRITVTENGIIVPREAEIVIAADGFEDLIISVYQEGSLPNKREMTLKGWVYCNNVGIPEVVVSDGYEVTVTDENGVYYLPSKKQNKYLFISVPGNYEVPYTGKLPQFFKKLTEAPIVVERHDFELTAVDNNKHVVLTMTDFHLAKRVDDLVQFEKMLVDINGVIADYKSSGTKVYGLTLGDLSWDSYWYSNNFTLEDYIPYMNKIDAPVFNTMGNHDNNPYAEGDWAAQQFYRDHLCPNYYSFNLGSIHYVVLDDIVYHNDGGAQGIMGKRNYDDRITTEQIEWLKKDLEKVKDKSAPLIIALHIPVFSYPDVNNSATPHLDNFEDLYSCLAGFSDVHIVAGHSHNNTTFIHSDSMTEHVIAGISATWWWTGYSGHAGNHICRDGSVGGYGVWEVDEKQMQWYYKSMGYDRDYQFRSYDLNSIEITAAKYAPYANATYAPKVPDYAGVYATASTDNEVLINVWGYDKDWTITVKEGTTTLPVTQVSGKDPLHTISYAIARLNRNAEPSSGFVATNTAHLFKVKASSPVSTLNIQVTDRFGRTYTETMTRPKDLSTNMK